MGVIRKKTAVRGGEGGVKYVCDVCSADITSTVSHHSQIIASSHFRAEADVQTPRSESDALTAPVATTTYVSYASRMANRHITINPRPMPFA